LRGAPWQSAAAFFPRLFRKGLAGPVGGLLGARVGRRLSPEVLRGVIVVVGVAAIVRLLV
jgi:uncharacterized protein